MPRYEYLNVGVLDVEEIRGNGLTDSMGLPYCAGTRWWVNSTGGNNATGESGKTPSRPFATLDYALSRCTDSKCDQIMLMPGHAETITGAGGITLDKIGVDVIGLGRYDLRPRFLMDGAATVTCLVTAAEAGLRNIIFAAGHSDITTFCTVTAKGFALEYCHFERNTTDENFVAIVTAGVADNDYDGMELIGNVLDFGGDAGELTPISLVKDSKDVRIIGNKIYGDFDTTPYAAIYSPNTEHHMAIEVAYNQIHNLHDADSVVGISLGSTTSTGFMHHNMVYALDVAGATPFVTAATGITLIENYYNFVGSTSQGYLHPAASILA